ncbi:MAG: pectate lyase [Pseudomonadota bacterium]
MSPTLSRRAILASSAALATFAAVPALAQTTPAGPRPDRAAILAAMKRATAFMTDEAAVNGGYVWTYLPDFSRRWGELEAAPTMIWVQPPGTGTMGHAFLDAYHATGDEQFYEACKSAADALVRGQHPAGGWNYVIDTAGEDSLRRWYDTYGKNAWRMEEFQRYYGNATFDDAGTSEASQLLLRLYLEKRDRAYLAPLQRAVHFVLDSQYANGGWPQRFPAATDAGLHGHRAYTADITFNDDVAGENLEFLIFAYQTLGDRLSSGAAGRGLTRDRLMDCIRRGMDIFLETQQPAPQAGWGLQHFADTLKPSPARTYEPESLATHTTANNVQQLLNFYRLTGDRKYISRVPEALDWLDSVALPPELRLNGRTHPTFIEPGTNQAWYIHRRGSNVVNGEYYADRNPNDTLVHYGSFRTLNIEGLREQYAALSAQTPEQVSAGSPLLARPGAKALPKYFTLRDVAWQDMGADARRARPPAAARAGQLLTSLNARGYWPTPLTATSNPYIGDGSATPTGGEYRITRVGDLTDTSPWNTDFPVEGVSTESFVRNMGDLIEALSTPAA